MTWFKRLLQTLGLPAAPTRLPAEAIEADLLPLIETLADEENTTVEHMAYELLYSAALQRRTDLHNLRQWQELTPREQQTAAFVCLGCTNQQIAGLMVISPNTVKTHIRSIYAKFSVNSKAELQQALAGWDFRAWLNEQNVRSPDDPPGGLTPRG